MISGGRGGLAMDSMRIPTLLLECFFERKNLGGRASSWVQSSFMGVKPFQVTIIIVMVVVA